MAPLTWPLYVAMERGREEALDYLRAHLREHWEDLARAEFYGGGDGNAGRLA